MTRHRFFRHCRTLVLAGLVAASLPPMTAAFEAQGGLPQPLPDKQKAAAAKAAADTSPKAVVRTQTEAMNSGALADEDMARSLLKRGTAHNALEHYSQALADLTGAIFIGKLSDGELREAYRERAKAYSATGQTRMAQQDAAKAGSSGSLASVAPPRDTGGEAGVDVSQLKLPEFKTSVQPAAEEEGAGQKATATPAAAAPQEGGTHSLPTFTTSIVRE